MAYGFMDIARTPSVQDAQAEMGADHLWSNFKGHREFNRFTDQEAAFIAQRDSFYIASVSETGWPYVQHRGGPPGFLKMLDEFSDGNGRSDPQEALNQRPLWWIIGTSLGFEAVILGIACWIFCRRDF